jgi:2-dehydro-3-deoxyphosphogluconate aldolase/(4S)-4-hydroxy-2-oxoglutarate aldolase
MQLLDLGYKCFKFFPAEAVGGIKYINSLKGPFPEIMFCPTGGINEDNVKIWFKQKNVICVGGSWIIPSDIENYKEITKRALFASKLVK